MTEKEYVKKVIMYTLGALHDLADAGLVDKGNIQTKPKGTAYYDQLKASGFVPRSVADVKLALLSLGAEHEGIDTLAIVCMNADEYIKESKNV